MKTAHAQKKEKDFNLTVSPNNTRPNTIYFFEYNCFLRLKK